MERFGITAAIDGDTCTLIITGEVDLARAPEIIDLGTASLDESWSQSLTIDLRAVTFMDSTGLGALITLHNAAEARGKRVALRSVPPRVHRLLKLTSLDGFFAIADATTPIPPVHQPADPDALPCPA
jgi:anti-sigma B factor antagonist